MLEETREKAAVHLFVMILILTIFRLPCASLADAGAPEILEEVVVTAEKRQQIVRDIPVSITVIDDLQIEAHDVRQVRDVFNLVPNLSVSSQNQGVTYMGCRGISTNMLNRRNPFVMYVDGVPYNHITGYNADFTNVKSIEILRGPQGTLFGKNAMGGVMNVITKAPSNTLEGNVSLDVAENETYEFKTAVNGPIKEGEPPKPKGIGLPASLRLAWHSKECQVLRSLHRL